MLLRISAWTGGAMLALILTATTLPAQPPEGRRDRDVPRERDGEARQRDGDRGPRDRDPGDRDRPERGARDGDRPDRGPRDGDRPEGGPRDRGPGDRPGFGPGRSGGDMDFGAIAGRMLERFDKDGDEKLDTTELTAALREMRSMGGRPTGPPEGGPGDRDRGPGDRGPGDRGLEGRGPGEMLKRIFEMGDKNGDGKLTGEEVPPRMRENMDRIDTNDDGAIDKAEAEAMMERFRGGRPGGDRPRDGARQRDGDGPREGGDRPRRPPVE